MAHKQDLSKTSRGKTTKLEPRVDLADPGSVWDSVRSADPCCTNTQEFCRNS